MASAYRRGRSFAQETRSATWPFADMEGTHGFFERRTHPVVARVFIYLDEVCRGAGEVVFMNNPVSGLVILAALFTFDRRCALHGLLGLLVSTGTAKMLRAGGHKGYDAVIMGLFGFNGLLVGLGIATFTEDEPKSNIVQAAAVLIFSILCPIVQKSVTRWLHPLPCFTLPFNICAIWFLGGAHSYNRFNSALGPVLLAASDGPTGYCIHDVASTSCESAWDYVQGFLVASIHGVCQIYLAQSVLSGSLILVGMSICSPPCMALTAIGSAVGCATALLVGGDVTSIYQGLWGFNPALTCCAIGGGIFGARGLSQLWWAVFGAVVTVFLQHALAGLLAPGGVVTFTAPFCIASLFLLGAGLVPPAAAPDDELAENDDLRTSSQGEKAPMPTTTVTHASPLRVYPQMQLV